jgi:hypothetical protein
VVVFGISGERHADDLINTICGTLLSEAVRASAVKVARRLFGELQKWNEVFKGSALLFIALISRSSCEGDDSRLREA